MKKPLLFAAVFAFGALFCLSGCSARAPEIPKSSKSVFVGFSAKGVKFADMGFLDEYDGKKSLQVYALGSPALKISFDEYVCVSSNCLSGGDFADSYIAKGLYGDIMGDVLGKRELKLQSSNVVRTEKGFIQTVATNDYDIFYRAEEDEIYFMERKNGFKFTARFLD